MTFESPGQSSQKLDSVQALRAVATLLVLLYHLIHTGAYGWIGADGEVRGSAALFAAVGFAGVDLFFVISGVVMVVTCYDRFGRRGESASFLARRVARIYPLYWLATLAVLALSWLWPELATRNKFEATALVKSLLLWPQAEFPAVAVGWTLTFEMFFYVVFAGLLMLPRRMLPAAFALWSAVIVAMFVEFNNPAYKQTAEGHLSLPLVASPLALEFIAGCCVGWTVRRGVYALAGVAMAIGVALFLGVGVYVGQQFPEEARYGLVRAGVFGGAATFTVYGAIGLERRGLLRIPQWLVFWGDASYSTYLTHMYVLWLIAAAWPKANTQVHWGVMSDAGAFAHTLTAIAACGLVASICHVAIERPLHRYLIGRLSRRQ